MVDIFALVTERVCIAVEDWGVLRGRCILWPVPVGCVAFVTTLVTKSLFVGVQEPSVPGQEVASIMNAEGLLDVSDNKIIELGR